MRGERLEFPGAAHINNWEDVWRSIPKSLKVTWPQRKLDKAGVGGEAETLGERHATAVMAENRVASVGWRLCISELIFIQ